MRAIIFILLKIAEAIVVVFVPYFLGVTFSTEESAFMNWLWGMVVLCCIVGAGMIFYFIVIGNFALSGKINKRFKR